MSIFQIDVKVKGKVNVMYARSYVCECIYKYINIYIYIYVCICLASYMRLSVCPSLSAFACLCMHVCVCVHLLKRHSVAPGSRQTAQDCEDLNYKYGWRKRDKSIHLQNNYYYYCICGDMWLQNLHNAHCIYG